MHLLKLGNNGKPILTRFIASNIPNYAILSHTWDADEQEVTFKDLADGVGTSKLGYRKIRFCGEQAQKDGLQYFWIDSCCIDKSSSSELQEAINSMFRWYQNAAICYAYLTDVSIGKHSRSSQPLWHLGFSQSRWFTRGWTLQELLAPPSVEFFSREGKRLGDKRSLEVQVQQITGIAIQALRGKSLSEFSVDERMSWAANRTTTIDEDQVYCLLGIFYVYLPLIYGEGKENAFRRLRQEMHGFGVNLFSLLPYAADAPFNSTQRRHDPMCLPNTRLNLLRDIHSWADGQDEPCIFWLNGLAGTGKSTIARTVARRYLDQKRLGASFFFSRGGGEVGHAGKFVTSIALQLASSVPSLDQYVYDAFRERREIASQSLSDQWQQLVLRPLSKLSGCSAQAIYVLVVDALDECDNDMDIRIIVHLLAEAQLLKTPGIRIFLTSRTEVLIRNGFVGVSDSEHREFILHSISPSIVNQDIHTFLEHSFKLIARERALAPGWPGQEIVKRLVHSADGLFIWAAITCRFIREGKRFAAKRLDIILENSSIEMNAAEKHLDDIYSTVLRNSIAPGYSVDEAEELRSMLKSLLGSIVTLFSSLSAQSLSTLMSTTQDHLAQNLNDLHSILNVPEDPTLPIRLHHSSFQDFLYKQSRCGEFWVDEKRAHQVLADRCIQLMSISLEKDVCGIDAPGMLVFDAERSRIERGLPPEVRYACLYWIEHVLKGGTQLRDNDQVHIFLHKHFLHWLEALGWIGKIPEGVHAILSLETSISSYDCADLWSFIHDAKRFALYNRSAIEQAPLQTYCSSLIFIPTTSIIRKQYEDWIPKWIRSLPKVEENWNPALQTLGGHLSPIIALTFSWDSKMLASVSGDNTVKLWDAGSGALQQTLTGHTSSVMSVAFSPDRKTLASASGDKTVKLWDTGSGALQETLNGHCYPVNSVAFSPDGKMLASASDDETVKLWNTGSGTVQQALNGHSNKVNAVAFSSDGKILASASCDKTVKLWDAESGVLRQTLEGHSDYVSAVAFSPDGRKLASASYDSTINIWATETGVLLQTFEGHLSSVTDVAYSPNGKTLASASFDSTIKVWDASSGTVQRTLEGHSTWVNAVAFCPDGKILASGSVDQTIKLWDVGIDAVLQTQKSHSCYVTTIAFSPDGKTLVSGSLDNIVKLWDTGSGTLLQTLKGHSSYVSAVAFSSDGRLLASVCGDGTVKIWATGTGALLQEFEEDHPIPVNAMTFSPDTTTLASAFNDGRVNLWNPVLGVIQQTLEGHSNSVSAVTFSPDSMMLASASKDETVKLWDVRSGTLMQTLKGHAGSVSIVVFSPDGKTLASASDDGTIKLWDVGSGALQETFKHHSSSVSAVAFSPDGTFLQTDWGLLPTSSTASNDTADLPTQLTPSFFVRDQWVYRDTKRILWIPYDRQPNCTAVHGGIIGIGCESGQVICMQLA